jgi:hypothetical protein
MSSESVMVESIAQHGAKGNATCVCNRLPLQRQSHPNMDGTDGIFPL